VLEEQLNVVIDQRGVHVMQNEDVGQVHEKREPETGPDPRLGSAGDEELDSWNLLNEPPQNGEDGGRWFIVLTFIQSIDHDDR
jgi:hypothetical protein